MDGRYAPEQKNPRPDGTRVIFFSGEELVARLTSLVQPPRMHLVHFFGCLDPHSITEGESAMDVLNLHFLNNLLFVELDGGLWLVNTGERFSFGSAQGVTLDGVWCPIVYASRPGNRELDATSLAKSTGVPCLGLLGLDILNRFDHIVDVPGGTLTVSTGELHHQGQEIALGEFMEWPIITAQVGNGIYRVFFDTGAQVSYFTNFLLRGFPPGGKVDVFSAVDGHFQTDTYEVPISLGGNPFTLRCGILHANCIADMITACTQGILGNEFLRDRTVGYFPRRGIMSL